MPACGQPTGHYSADLFNYLLKTHMTQTNVSMFDIIAYVESKNNPHAMRFEPGVYDHLSAGGAMNVVALNNIVKLNRCSQATARTIYSTSWGATQIMGFNLYDGLYAGDVVSFCADPIAQAAAFDGFCRKANLIASVTDMASTPMLRFHFAKIYNGDPNAYAPLIVDALKHFGLQVTE